jgi:phenylacetate-CoA ligase
VSTKYSFLFENFMLPIYDLARKTSRFRNGRVLDRTQWLSREEIEKMQNRNLRFLINHAYNTVPFYKKQFRENGLLPSDIKSTADLVKLPSISKADIRDNLQDFISKGYPRKNLVASESGGSGDQVKFFVTKDQLSWEIAAEYRAYKWAGFRRGDPIFLFWASPIDKGKDRGLIKHFSRVLERSFIADTYVISNEVLARFARLLRNSNPEIIRGYTSSVYMMAKYLVENNIDNVRPRAVITSAETLFDFMRKTIKDAFDCPIFDYYGSREVGGIAAECEEHSGYHISAENVVTEFIADGEQVSMGEKGVITLTSLRNFGMPLIRYEIGDVGVPTDENCVCGRGLPVMSSIEGRVSEFLAVYDEESGRVNPVGPVYPSVIIALMHLPLVSVRVIQESLNKVIFKAVKSESYTQKHTEFLLDYLHKFLGDKIDIQLEFVESLPPLPSGKRSVFVSKINAFENNVA